MNYGALDCSTAQLSTFVLDIPNGEKHKWISLHWISAESLVEHSIYKPFVDQGLIRAVPGKTLGLVSTIIEDIQALQRKNDFIEVCVDPWSPGFSSVVQGALGIQIIDYRLTYSMLSEPSHTFLASHTELLRESPVLAWMFQNTKFLEDAVGHIKPAKKYIDRPISGLVTGIMALGRAMQKMRDWDMYVA